MKKRESVSNSLFSLFYWIFFTPTIDIEPFLLEQMTGIEPAYSAWEADVLPLNYICMYMDAGNTSPAYFSEGDEIGHFLLKHGVGHKPAGSEVDTPLDYGDYYFLEALLRVKQ